jgi:hemin uptake protein HemP
MEHKDRPDQDRKPVAQAGARSVPRISSSELMRRQSELIIEHDGREYRLRITQSGKLILTA